MDGPGVPNTPDKAALDAPRTGALGGVAFSSGALGGVAFSSSEELSGHHAFLSAMIC